MLSIYRVYIRNHIFIYQYIAMKFKKLTYVFSSLICSIVFAQVQSPNEFLGYELGTQFTRHHQVIDYVKHVAEQSPLVQTKSYGKTYEGRTLQLAFISSEENMAQLETLRKDHLKRINLLQGKQKSDKEISVVWLSYNVHGNESTSTEAALKTLYTLATEKKEWLDNLIVIIDPCINPDGRDRYVNWYNQVKSTPYDNDPISNEHYEDWPGGRYNHYYHDLNRDWAWLTQVESQQRIPVYHQWMPQIHVDFHEQGVDSPYYFAPAAVPYHEIITDFQRDFQTTIGKNHATYFDKEGWLYFTKEVFDLLYPGYGDTYPTFHGAIGMTYEQGGSGRAGLGIINTVGDNLTLKDRISHHYTSGLSTVEVAHHNSKKLNSEFKTYYQNTKGKFSTYALEGHKDKIAALKKLLDSHHIPVSGLSKQTNIKGIDYHTQQTKTMRFDNGALILDGNGQKSQMIQALFEPQTILSDSVTYDITSWALPYAYGLKGIASNQTIQGVDYKVKENKVISVNPGAYAYAAKRETIDDGKYIAALIKEGIRAYYNEVPLTNGGMYWPMGSIFVLRGENKQHLNLAEKINAIAKKTGQDVMSLSSGFSDEGPDLGSNQIQYIANKKIGILKSDSASPSGYGEIWHFFEQQLKYPLTQLSDTRINERVLNGLDVLIIPPGYYGPFDKKSEQLNQWIKRGGRIIAIGSALSGFANSDFYGLKAKENGIEKSESKRYADQERDNISDAIYGSIYAAKIDSTHPLSAGYNSSYFTLKNSAKAFELLKNNGTAAYIPSESKPLAGFSGSKAITLQQNSLLFGTEKIGRGSVVYIVDNPLYRSFWENGKLWFVNALFF